MHQVRKTLFYLVWSMEHSLDPCRCTLQWSQNKVTMGDSEMKNLRSSRMELGKDSTLTWQEIVSGKRLAVWLRFTWLFSLILASGVFWGEGYNFSACVSYVLWSVCWRWLEMAVSGTGQPWSFSKKPPLQPSHCQHLVTCTQCLGKIKGKKNHQGFIAQCLIRIWKS